MMDRNSENELKKLKSELKLKDKEIKKYLEKIDILEENIMDIESNLAKASDNGNIGNIIILKNRVKHLERYTRKLKDKMGFFRLENIRLKKALEEGNKAFYDQLSLIKVVENNSSSTKLEDSNPEIKENPEFQSESYTYLDLKCPECEIQKKLKIPIKLIKPSMKEMMISIPQYLICEHSFKILIDKSLHIKKYLIENYESSQIKISNNNASNQALISIIQTLIDEIEILGVALLDLEWNIIIASVPYESISNLLKEIRLRKELQIQEIVKIYFELENQQKIFIEDIEIMGHNYILGLIFSQKVNFGIGTMLYRDIKEKLLKSLL